MAEILWITKIEYIELKYFPDTNNCPQARMHVWTTSGYNVIELCS